MVTQNQATETPQFAGQPLGQGPGRHPLGVLADGYLAELDQALFRYCASEREWDNLAEVLAALRMTLGAVTTLLWDDEALAATARLEHEICQGWERDLRDRQAAAEGGAPCSS